MADSILDVISKQEMIRSATTLLCGREQSLIIVAKSHPFDEEAVVQAARDLYDAESFRCREIAKVAEANSLDALNRLAGNADE